VCELTCDTGIPTATRRRPSRFWVFFLPFVSWVFFAVLPGCNETGHVAWGQTARADFFVATNGNDSWSGRLAEPSEDGTDGPFATIAAARDAIRRGRKKAALHAPVTVLIRKGVYRLERPIEFKPEDSGTEKSPVTYAAYPGEKPVISGGRPITGWKKQSDGLWSARIADVKGGKWYFKQFFVNGERRPRARTPNDGYLRTDGPIEPLGDRKKARGDKSKKMGFRYKPSDIKRWDNLEDVNIVLYHAWTASVHWIASLDEHDHIVRFTAPSNWPVGWWENKQRYYVENYREALDSPGEWYLDRKAGVLWYRPLRGENPNEADVVAPVLRHLVLFSGEPNEEKFVDHIQIRGLSFQHADWFVKDKGFADGQAGVQFLKGAIHAVGARHCVLENCEIAHVGEYALWRARGCKNNSVRGCHIYDMGGGGVVIGETARPSNKPTSLPGDAECNVVDNNFIHDGGHVWREGIGVIVLRSSHNQVTHNEVCDFFYSGMSVGWNWGYAPSSANHNIIEHNHIHHLGFGVLSDMGGIYTLGVSPGTRLRCNLIHDVYSYSYGGWGLYTDEGSSEILLENNIVYNTKTGGFHQHYGRENIVRNNIFAFSREAQIIRSREEEHNSFTFERNIVYCSNDQILSGNWRNGNYRIDKNLYWSTTDDILDFDGLEFDEWQAKGRDVNSIIADPKFVNAKQYDFQLKSDSPAFKIAFKPIDIGEVGLYGEREWVDVPKRIKHRKAEIPLQIKPQRIDDRFEETPVGQPAAAGTIRGEEKGASIRVTDETAAGGKHSLKFTDAPGLQQVWHPYLFYQPCLKSGTVRFSFDIRLEKGAVLFHQWRDAANPYRVGPSIHFLLGGELKVRDRALMKLPFGKWVHFDILCPLGRKAGTYDLTVTVRGEKARRFDRLPVASERWRRLRWLGFVSVAPGRAVFYLDNVKLSPADR